MTSTATHAHHDDEPEDCAWCGRPVEDCDTTPEHEDHWCNRTESHDTVEVWCPGADRRR